MMAVATGNMVSFKPANLNYPTNGARALTLDADMSASPIFTFDFTALLADQVIDQVQSIWIDNTGNTSAVDFYFDGAPRSHHVRCEAYCQGLFPVTMPEQSGRMHAATPGGVNVPVILYNIPMPYYVSGPADGALVVPPLTNAPLDFEPLAVGDNTLIAGVLGQTIKTYRMLFVIGDNATIQFFNGPSADAHPLTGPIIMFGGGSFNISPSGIPWWTCSAGKDLVLKSSAAVQLGGMEGYIQS